MQTDALLHFCGFLCVIYQKLYFLILGEVEKKKKKKFSIVIHVAGIVNWMIKTQSNLWGLCELLMKTSVDAVMMFLLPTLENLNWII